MLFNKLSRVSFGILYTAPTRADCTFAAFILLMNAAFEPGAASTPLAVTELPAALEPRAASDTLTVACTVASLEPLLTFGMSPVTTAAFSVSYPLPAASSAMRNLRFFVCLRDMGRFWVPPPLCGGAWCSFSSRRDHFSASSFASVTMHSMRSAGATTLISQHARFHFSLSVKAFVYMSAAMRSESS